MKKHTHTANQDLETLAEDAKALIAATGHLAEEKVVEARKRLNSALEKGRETLENMQDRAVASAKAADETIREHPYQAIGIAFGVGALIGFLVSRRH